MEAQELLPAVGSDAGTGEASGIDASSTLTSAEGELAVRRQRCLTLQLQVSASALPPPVQPKDHPTAASTWLPCSSRSFRAFVSGVERARSRQSLSPRARSRPSRFARVQHVLTSSRRETGAPMTAAHRDGARAPGSLQVPALAADGGLDWSAKAKATLFASWDVPAQTCLRQAALD